jgi:hypothetical protein
MGTGVPRSGVLRCPTVPPTTSPKRSPKKVSCEDCYFRCNLLCALQDDLPCATFRPNHPEGLRPPQQLRFTFRQERRSRAAWAFPTAQEQAALHR